MRIAIIGAGISGNLAARLLASRHEVTLFEAGNKPGGHTKTVNVPTKDGLVPVDTGFMVFNRKTYPKFCRMLELLGVDSQPSDMSFSVRCDKSGIEYNGSSLNGLFATRRNVCRPGFYRMIVDILRFNRLVVSESELESEKLGDFLDRHQLGQAFRQQYLIPMLAAIWSAAPGSVESLPCKFLLGFMRNHALVQLRHRPQWRTIVGGANNYVERLLEPIKQRVRVGEPIESVERFESHVVVTPRGRAGESFDHVVFASHADQTLTMLHDATNSEAEILSAFPYQPNLAYLHSDVRQMPLRPRAWASWNYRSAASDQSRPSVTYHLNRLQNLPTSQQVFVTLNPPDQIAHDRTWQEINFHHPAYSLRSIDAQSRWQEINGNRTWFCGAYWGYGFHEDGVNSALRVADSFGVSLEDLEKPVTRQEVSPSQKHAGPVAV